MTSAAKLQAAVKLHQAGRFNEATAVYREVLRHDPRNSDALHLLGLAAHQQGDHDSALRHIGAAVALSPDQAGYQSNLGEAYRALGRLDEAVESYGRALRIDPRCAAAHHNLGHALRQRGDVARAADSYRAAIKVKPDYFDALASLARLLIGQRSYAEALEPAQRAAALRPAHAEAQHLHGQALLAMNRAAEAVEPLSRAAAQNPQSAVVANDLGGALMALKRYEEAEEWFRRALALDPTCGPAHLNLAQLCRRPGDNQAALAHFEQAVRHSPGDVRAWHGMAQVLRQLDRPKECIACCQHALSVDPTSVEANLELANALKDMAQFEQALPYYEQIVQVRPDWAEVHFRLANVYSNQGRAEEAIASYGRCLALDDTNQTRFAQATVLPVLYEDDADIAQWREQFQSSVNRLVDEGRKIDPLRESVPNIFYLAYQGKNDRHLLEQVSKLFVAHPSMVRPGRRPVGRRIRLAFVSRYFKDHTIGKFMEGLIGAVSRDRFEVIVCALGDPRDAVAQRIASRADQAVSMPCHARTAAEQIAGAAIDVLVYADIGMDPFTSCLARMRLAPVQCAMWGHPVTTGMPTVDYYLSSRLLEPDDADEHYSERLVRLDGLPAWYERPQLAGPPRGREHFQLPTDKHLYLCPQSLFKFHPHIDATLAEILRGDPQGMLVITRGAYQSHVDQLVARFRRHMPDCVDRVRFLSNVPRGDFLHLLAAGDVLLDPFHFGGGNSSYEALAVGAPLVTWPGQFMRGRVTLGCYRRMGFLDCVADSPTHYSQLALRLANDRELNRATRERVHTAANELFEDDRSLRAMEEFFQRAVDEPRAWREE